MGFHVDTTGNVWLGTGNAGTTLAQAITAGPPNFYVTSTGSVNAISGAIGGIVIDANGVESTNYNASTNTGWRLNNDSASIKDGSDVGGISVTGTSIQSTNFSGSNGFQINADGTAIFRSVSINGFATTTQVNNAQSTADQGIIDAASAQSTANTANGTANTANSTANTANGTANTANGTANSVDTTVNTLKTNLFYNGTTEINGGTIRTGTISADDITTGTLQTNVSTNGTISCQTLGVSGNATITSTGTFGGNVKAQNFQSINTTFTINRNTTSNGMQISGSGSGAYVRGYNSSGSLQTIYSPYSGVSDERLKENIADLTIGLDEINALRPVTFDWKSSDIDDVPNGRYGFIAQEVQEVVPSMISTDPSKRIEISEDEDGEIVETEIDNFITLDDGTKISNAKRIDEKPLTYMLVKAVQELSTQISDLTARIETLEG
jgi:hypothetical protein